MLNPIERTHVPCLICSQETAPLRPQVPLWSSLADGDDVLVLNTKLDGRESPSVEIAGLSHVAAAAAAP